jgi:hypothetical protein
MKRIVKLNFYILLMYNIDNIVLVRDLMSSKIQFKMSSKIQIKRNPESLVKLLIGISQRRVNECETDYEIVKLTTRRSIAIIKS